MHLGAIKPEVSNVPLEGLFRSTLRGLKRNWACEGVGNWKLKQEESQRTLQLKFLVDSRFQFDIHFEATGLLRQLAPGCGNRTGCEQIASIWLQLGTNEALNSMNIDCTQSRSSNEAKSITNDFLLPSQWTHINASTIVDGFTDFCDVCTMGECEVWKLENKR